MVVCFCKGPAPTATSGPRVSAVPFVRAPLRFIQYPNRIVDARNQAPAPASSAPAISINPPSAASTRNTTMITTIGGVGVPRGLNHHVSADVRTAVASITATLGLLQARAERLDRNLPVSPLQTPGTSPRIGTGPDWEEGDDDDGADTQGSPEV